MRHAFTLIELIFVIVLIGVLSGIGFYMNRSDTTRTDAQYTLLKLKEARYRAISYKSPSTTGVDGGCVVLSKDALSSNEPPRHDIKSTLTINPLLTNDTVCFDELGRPHDGNFTTLGSLVRDDVTLSFQNGDHNTKIRLFSQSGYAIIPCNN